MSWKVTETKNFEVGIDLEGRRGFFEHDVYGEEVGGGLWFKDGALVDYDGTFELPMEVLKELRDNRGVKIDKMFYSSLVFPADVLFPFPKKEEV